jgi:hypothetical protein
MSTEVEGHAAISARKVAILHAGTSQPLARHPDTKKYLLVL